MEADICSSAKIYSRKLKTHILDLFVHDQGFNAVELESSPTTQGPFSPSA